jgi:hypothetical protein
MKTKAAVLWERGQPWRIEEIEPLRAQGERGIDQAAVDRFAPLRLPVRRETVAVVG